MKGWVGGALVAVVAVVLGIVWLNRDDPGARTVPERETEAPKPPKLNLRVKEHDPVVSVLGLTMEDFERSKHAGGGSGIRAKRSPEAMEADYRSERELRVWMARQMTNRLVPRLGLDEDQAQGFLDAAMDRGDLVRMAFYREHGGGMTTQELAETRKRAAANFELALKRILTKEQIEEFRRIEDSHEGPDNEDWGFGVVFGHGSGGGRAHRPDPEK